MTLSYRKAVSRKNGTRRIALLQWISCEKNQPCICTISRCKAVHYYVFNHFLIHAGNHSTDLFAHPVEKEADFEEKLRDCVEKSYLFVIRRGLSVGFRNFGILVKRQLIHLNQLIVIIPGAFLIKRDQAYSLRIVTVICVFSASRNIHDIYAVDGDAEGVFVVVTVKFGKAVTAAEDAIALTFDGAIPGEGIANEDLCTILANLLDNAIEACRKLPATAERRIRVKGAGLNDTFLLHVENPTMLTAVPAKTTKRDSRNHGIGLRNVTRVAKSYDGSVSCNVDNGVFSADVRLCLQQKTEE